TGEEKLSSFIKDFTASGGRVLITRLNEEELTLFKKSGLYEHVGSSSFYPDEESAIASVSRLEDESEKVDKILAYRRLHMNDSGRPYLYLLIFVIAYTLITPLIVEEVILNQLNFAIVIGLLFMIFVKLNRKK